MISDNNVIVQCHIASQEEDPQWYILYRRSAGDETFPFIDVWSDPLSQAGVVATCIRGCHYDTHCKSKEMCHLGECLPKVCPSRSPSSHNTILMMQKAAKSGTKSTIRCAIGHVYSVSNVLLKKF